MTTAVAPPRRRDRRHRSARPVTFSPQTDALLDARVARTGQTRGAVLEWIVWDRLAGPAAGPGRRL